MPPTDTPSFDPTLFATFTALAGIFFTIVALWYTIPPGRYKNWIFLICNAVLWIIINLAVYLSVNPKLVAINSILWSNIVLVVVLLLGSVVYVVNAKQFDERLSYLPKRVPQTLRFGLNHIDNVITSYYVGKANVTLKDKKDAMSAVLHQISITTAPSSIDNLARIGLFEVRDGGRFRILATHHVDAHRLPRLERLFSHDRSNPRGIVGWAVIQREAIFIPNLNEAPPEVRKRYEITEDNKLPGQTAESILCVPVFDSKPVTENSVCMAVISISASSKNYLTDRILADVNQYADRVRTLLVGLNSRILFDPDINYGIRAITISGEAGAGKSTLARELNSILSLVGWRTVSIGKRFRDFCNAKGITISEIEKLPDKIHQEFDEYQKLMLTEEEFILFESRLSGYLARDIPDVFKVYCSLPFPERVKRVSAKMKISNEDAEKTVSDRDKKDLERYRRLYSIEDYRERDYYDLFLTTDQPPHILAQQVIEQIKVYEQSGFATSYE